MFISYEMQQIYVFSLPTRAYITLSVMCERLLQYTISILFVHFSNLADYEWNPNINNV